MAKSKVAKKFHLDSDGYLTTKPDRQLTTEEEAADAAEAAIGEALEEGGAIAEAIAASGGGANGVMKVVLNTSTLTADKTAKEIYDHVQAGGTAIMISDDGNAGCYFLTRCLWQDEELYVIDFMTFDLGNSNKTLSVRQYGLENGYSDSDVKYYAATPVSITGN